MCIRDSPNGDTSEERFEAQKRAENFGIAESAAVDFAATYEGTTDIPKNTSRKNVLV